METPYYEPISCNMPIIVELDHLMTPRLPYLNSHRDTYEERPVLYPLQLRQQNYSRHTVSVYEVPI